MNVELFTICEAATDQQGKVNILGTFDSIQGGAVPVVHPHCAVVVRLRFAKSEEGEHLIKINIIDEDGKPVVPPFETKGNVRFGNIPRTTIAVNMILNLQGLKFASFGEYAVDLSVDGRHEASLPLTVSQMPEIKEQ
jgi:hypothetical protein